MCIIHKVNGFNKIYKYKSFDKEFKDLFHSKSDLNRYQKWLTRRLQMLDIGGTTCINGVQFEKIEKDIYSIRYTRSKLNPRVLFTFCLGNGYTVLLAATVEKSSSDYEPVKEAARSRIQLIRRELDL